MNFLTPLQVRRLGIIAAVLIVLGSFGGGSLQRRNSLLSLSGMDFLSFGHGATFSNLTLWLGTVLFVISWVFLGKLVVSKTISIDWLRKSVYMWVLPLSAAAPIMSRDVYSYLMQGSLARDGFDAYTQGPAANPNQILFEVSHDWRNTTTPYGPLHLWIGEGITTLWGNNVTAGVYMFKLLSLLGFLAIMWAVPKIADALGVDPIFALWLGVVNPIIVFHLIGGMHNEAIMVGLVSIGLYYTVANTAQRPHAQKFLGGIYPSFFLGVLFVSTATALKASAALILPFMVWIVVNHQAQQGKNPLVAFIIAAVAGALETIAVLAAITWASGASWGWIEALTGNSKVINPLSFPSFVAGIVGEAGRIGNEQYDFNSFLSTARSSSLIVIAVGFIFCWWYFRKRPITGAMWAYLITFTFNSVTLPWYYASVLPLAAVMTTFDTFKRWATIGSVVVALAFTGSGNHQLYNPLWMTITVICGWIAAQWLWPPTARVEKPTSKTPSPAPVA